MSEKRPAGKAFGEQFKDWRPASDSTPSEPPKPPPGAKNGGPDGLRRLYCGCLGSCRSHSPEEMDGIGFPWVPPPAEKLAPEAGSWVTCDRDRLPHRLDPFGWADVCVNPIAVATPRAAADLSDEEADKMAESLKH